MLSRWIQKVFGRKENTRKEAAARVSTPQTLPIINYVREKKITYCGKPKLENLAQELSNLEKKNLKGAIVEAGVALGGSAVVLAHLKSKSRPLYLYDVFAMIPPPTGHDDQDSHERYKVISEGQAKGLNENTYYGYVDNLLDVVKANITTSGVDIEKEQIHFVQGEYEKSMHIDFPVMLAHIDCDWYESIKTCLDQIEPHLVVGGSLVFDDYSSYKGAKKIIDERITHSDKYEKIFENRSIGFRRI